MLVSAFWHGFHPGYYLSFLTIPYCLAAEDLLLQAFYNDKSALQQRVVGSFLWFVKMRAFDYMSMGFLLLSFEDTMKYWSSIHYACHIWTAVLIVIGALFSPKFFMGSRKCKGRSRKEKSR